MSSISYVIRRASIPAFRRTSRSKSLDILLPTSIKTAVHPLLQHHVRLLNSPSTIHKHTMSSIDLENDPKGEQLTAPYLKLYSLGTPNGKKISIYLQLLEQTYSGVEYHYRGIDFSSNEQKEPWYIKLNPNGRIPTISDVDANGKQTVIFETGAILQYLGEKYDTEGKYYYHLKDGDLYWDQVKWLTFQVASHAPYQGQADHFVIFAQEKVPYGIKRYTDETKRVFGVYEIRLKENNGWLVGDRLNVADIAAFPWVRIAEKVNIDLGEFPALKAWVEKIEKIEGIQEGLNKK